MADRWIVLIITQFISAAIGFTFGFVTRTPIFILVGGFFFSLGTFAATWWGFDKWRKKKKKLKLH